MNIVREYRAEDLPILNEWIVARNGHSITNLAVSPYTWVVETDGQPTAIGMVYKFEGVPGATNGFIASRPGLALAAAKEALELLAETMVGKFIEIGVSVANFHIDKTGLSHLFEKAGFTHIGDRRDLVWVRKAV